MSSRNTIFLRVFFVLLMAMSVMSCRGHGSSGGDASDNTTPIYSSLAVKVYLEAPSVSGSLDMLTGLTGHLPTTDPYGVGVTCPGINSIPGVVDWVKVELWSSGPPITKSHALAGLLLKDSRVVDVDGVSPLKIAVEGDYNIVVKHRNHMAIMSPSKTLTIGSTLDVDFTTAANQAIYGNEPLFLLPNGRYGMHRGDFTQDCDISSADGQAAFNAIATYGGVHGYYNEDLTMDGVVDILDFYVWNSNDLDHRGSLSGFPGSACAISE